MRLRTKCFGIPIFYLMLIGIASAMILDVVIYANIEATGSYQGNIPARGFSVQDGDLTDPITFQPGEVDENLYYLSFPLYENQVDVKYQDALRIVPDGTITALRFSEIQRTSNGITEAWLTLREIGGTIEPATIITTSPTETCFAVLGNHNYSLNFRITTGTAVGSVETIKFKISRCT